MDSGARRIVQHDGLKASMAGPEMAKAFEASRASGRAGRQRQRCAIDALTGGRGGWPSSFDRADIRAAVFPGRNGAARSRSYQASGQAVNIPVCEIPARWAGEQAESFVKPLRQDGEQVIAQDVIDAGTALSGRLGGGFATADVASSHRSRPSAFTASWCCGQARPGSRASVRSASAASLIRAKSIETSPLRTGGPFKRAEITTPAH